MRPMLKFCGNHSFTDLKRTAASRADYLGLIFTKKSRRTVSAQQAARWLKLLSLSGKKLVGVFADEEPEEIEAVLRFVPLNILQFHGSEPPRFLRQIKASMRLPVWKAIRHRPNALDAMRDYAGFADGFIIDTQVKGILGGTGVSFNWQTIPAYQEEAARQGALCFIAGGVTPANIERLLCYHPPGIDIASGIERNFHKDRQLISKIENKVWMNDDQSASTGK